MSSNTSAFDGSNNITYSTIVRGNIPTKPRSSNNTSQDDMIGATEHTSNLLDHGGLDLVRPSSLTETSTMNNSPPNSSNASPRSTDDDDGCIFPLDVTDVADPNTSPYPHYRRGFHGGSASPYNRNSNRSPPSGKPNRNNNGSSYYSNGNRFRNHHHSGSYGSPSSSYTPKKYKSRSYVDFDQFQNHNQLMETNETPQEHRFDYLVIMDFEATCDSGINPIITRENQEMIEFPFVVMDLKTNQIIHQERHYVKPTLTEKLTPFCTQLTGITDETLQKEGIPLSFALQYFHRYAKTNFIGANKTFCILTDSEWDIKGLLIKEAKLKGIFIEPYFRTYYDLRREYTKCYPFAVVRGLRSMVEQSGLEFVGKHHNGLCDCLTVSEIVKRMLQDGHIFNEPITVSEYYDPFRDRSFGEFIQSPKPSLTDTDLLNIEASLSPNRRNRSISSASTPTSNISQNSTPASIDTEKRSQSLENTPTLKSESFSLPTSSTWPDEYIENILSKGTPSEDNQPHQQGTAKHYHSTQPTRSFDRNTPEHKTPKKKNNRKFYAKQSVSPPQNHFSDQFHH